MNYIFDGSYSGYLCCIFEAFERKEFDIIPATMQTMEINIFSENRQINTDAKKTNRILAGMEKILGKKEAKIFYHNFLSDNQSEWLNGFRLITELFRKGKLDIHNYGHPAILRMHQTVKKISRERHRMQAFIRFVKSEDHLYTAIVEPDFNVVPLVVDFFKNRFADQNWLIYDIRRNYGFHYDCHNIVEVSNNDKSEIRDPYQLEVDLDPQEKEYQHLWKTYFKSTNIESRKNLKLHLKHVPKRYWKYLTEKI
ncbi:TIGR03915 family putative DNA repair protein [Sphingobacterium sp. WOUb80]|uniref:TIGR03915 family putative DNA repair protein n=1 Tax=Sphingobacterium sp. WOUb80 TaxID=3234028 RepID=UPI003CF80C9C